MSGVLEYSVAKMQKMQLQSLIIICQFKSGKINVSLISLLRVFQVHYNFSNEIISLINL